MHFPLSILTVFYGLLFPCLQVPPELRPRALRERVVLARAQYGHHRAPLLGEHGLHGAREPRAAAHGRGAGPVPRRRAGRGGRGGGEPARRVPRLPLRARIPAGADAARIGGPGLRAPAAGHGRRHYIQRTIKRCAIIYSAPLNGAFSLMNINFTSSPASPAQPSPAQPASPFASSSVHRSIDRRRRKRSKIS